MAQDGRGVIDYHCSWMIMHTLATNGAPVITEQERTAFLAMLMYISSEFDCKVCRSNIAELVGLYGLPEGYNRIDYARWFWRAHNHANEHTYATHSPTQQYIDSHPYLTQDDRRWDMWANQKYMNPWFIS